MVPPSNLFYAATLHRIDYYWHVLCDLLRYDDVSWERVWVRQREVTSSCIAMDSYVPVCFKALIMKKNRHVCFQPFV